MTDITLRYLFFTWPDWEGGRQHIATDDNQPLCGSREVSPEQIEKRRVIVQEGPSDLRTVCQKCTRLKAAYIEKQRIAAWNREMGKK